MDLKKSQNDIVKVTLWMNLLFLVVGVFYFFWPAISLAIRHIVSDALPRLKWIFAPIINRTENLVRPLVAYGLGPASVYRYEDENGKRGLRGKLSFLGSRDDTALQSHSGDVKIANKED